MTSPSMRLLGVSVRGADRPTHATLPTSTAEVEEILTTFACRFPDAGLVVLDTCVRLEFYVEAVDDHEVLLHEVLCAAHGLEDRCPAAPLLSYELHGDDVARHLFRVATGLESPVLGDNQIMDQLRSASTAARRTGAIGDRQSELFRRALVVGKRARRETDIAAGGADWGRVVAASIAAELGDGSDRRALVLGGGRMARSVVAALADTGGFRRIDVANRTVDRAHEIAALGGGRGMPLDGADAAWCAADVVVCATAPGVEIAAPDTTNRGPRVIVDLVAGGSVTGASPARVRTLDSLEDWSDDRRLSSVDAVQGLCDEATADWRHWLDTRPLEAALAGLYGGIDGLVRDLVATFGPSSIADPSRSAAAHAVVKSWLHPHVDAIRSTAGRPAVVNPHPFEPSIEEHPTCAR